MNRKRFDNAENPWDIKYRLAPIDVGFDLRVADMAISVDPADDPIRVSYEEAGERYVVEGAQAEVLEHLGQVGYRFEIAKVRGVEVPE